MTPKPTLARDDRAQHTTPPARRPVGRRKGRDIEPAQMLRECRADLDRFVRSLDALRPRTTRRRNRRTT